MTDNNRIAKARRLAAELSYRVEKKFNRTYDCPGFMLIDETTNIAIAGGCPVPYSLTLDELEDELSFWRRKTDDADVDIDADQEFDQF